MYRALSILLFYFGTVLYVYSTHLMGGSMNYEYIGFNSTTGTYQYKVTVKIYRYCKDDSSTANLDPNIDVGVYYHDPSTPNADKSLYQVFNFNLTSSEFITLPPPGDSCTFLPNVCVQEGLYTDTIDLPSSTGGYHILHERCCRNGNIENLQTPGSEGMTFYAFIPPTSVVNNSPFFAEAPVPFICTKDTVSIVNTAIDEDGDLLKYSFVHPYRGSSSANEPVPYPPMIYNWPIQGITYSSGFSYNEPYGTNGYASINTSNGYTSYYNPNSYTTSNPGFFVVAIQINEYRNNVLIGRSRRDLQLIFIDCPANPAPNLSPNPDSGMVKTVYNLMEGDSVCIPISFSDQSGDSLTLTSSNLPSGSTLPNAKAKGTVSSKFCWNTNCNQGTPNNFIVKATDNGCPNKTTNKVFTININSFTGPNQISGFDTTCQNDKNVSYSVIGSTGSTFTWKVEGGTIIGSQTSTSVKINWALVDSGKIRLVEISKNGCPSDTVLKKVFLRKLPVPNAGTDLIVCPAESGTIGSPALPNYVYSWNPVNGLGSPNLALTSVTLNNIKSVNDTNLFVLKTTLNSCINFDTVKVIVKPNPVSSAGQDKIFCSGDTATLGANPTSGYTYLWSPGKDLNDSTISNPFITLINTGQLPFSFTYTVQTTLKACKTQDQVLVTVKPYPIADAGPPRILCHTDTVDIGVPTTPGYTYQWVPTTGIFNPLTSLTKITLENNTASRDTFIYKIITTLNGCSRTDQTDVIVKPLPITMAGNDISFCSGSSAQIGSATINGYRYQWSPVTGLSNDTISNPMVTLFTTGQKKTVQYIVTSLFEDCYNNDTIQVEVRPYPVAEAGNDTSVCSGDSIQIGANSTIGYSYKWSPATNINNINISNPWVTISNFTNKPDTFKYMVSTTLENCTSKDSIRIEIRPLPVPEAGPDVSFCSGDTLQIGTPPTNGYTYIWTPINGLSDKSVSNPTVTLLNLGTSPDSFIYKVKTTFYNCSLYDSVYVKVRPYPIANAGRDTSVCSGDSIHVGTISTTGYSYKWSPALNISNISISDPWVNINITSIQPDTIKYILLTTLDNCTSKDSIIITVRPLPKPEAGPDISFCSGDTLQIGSPPTNGYTYLWTPIVGLSNKSISNPTVTLSNTDTVPNSFMYKVKTTFYNCILYDSVNVNVRPYPLIDAGQNQIFCSGDTIQLRTISKPGYEYIWTPLAGLSNNLIASPLLSLINFNGNDDKNDTIFYIVKTTQFNCPSFDSVRIIVKPIPINTMAKIVRFCSGDTVNIGTPPRNNNVYSWSPGKGLSNSQIANPDLWLENSTTEIDTSTYFLITDLFACKRIDTLKVVVFPLPRTADISGSVSVCPGVRGVGYWVEPFDKKSDYQWTVSGTGTLVSGQGKDSILVNWGATANEKVWVIEQDSNGCIGDTMIMNVRINPVLWPPAALGKSRLCDDELDSILYKVVFTNGSQYNWHIQGGDSIGGIGKNTLLVNWDTLGINSAMVWYEETSKTIDTVCYGISDTLWISIFPDPVADSIIGDFDVCEFEKEVKYKSSGFDKSSFEWKINGTTLYNQVSPDSMIITWQKAGNFVISYIETTKDGCIGNTVDSLVSVHPLPLTSAIRGDTLVCPPFLKDVSYTVSGFEGSSFIWTVKNGIILSGQGTDSIRVEWSTAGDGELNVIENTKYLCSDAIISTKTFLDIVKLELLSVSVDTSDESVVHISWKFNDYRSSPDTVNIYHKNSPYFFPTDSLIHLPVSSVSYLDKAKDTRNTIYYYKIDGENVCKNPISSEKHNTLKNSVSNNENEKSIFINWNRYNGWLNGVTRYEVWRRLDNESSYSFYEQLNSDTFLILKNGDAGFKHCFRIKAVENSGNNQQSWSNSICVEFEHKLALSTAFTPNGDSKNDNWVIPMIELYPECELTVYNRWGSEVYHKTGYDNSWDGGNLPTGTYYYILDVKNRKEVYKGYLMLMR